MASVPNNEWYDMSSNMAPDDILVQAFWSNNSVESADYPRCKKIQQNSKHGFAESQGKVAVLGEMERLKW